MDITGIDVGALLVGFGSLVKSFRSDNAAKEQKKCLEERCSLLERRLDDGDKRFAGVDVKMDKLMEKVVDIDKGMTSIISYMKGKGFPL